MKIGIDISQTAYAGTGVANYTKNLVLALLRLDKKNDYILFFSSLRKTCPLAVGGFANASLKTFKFPPALLDLCWNRWHLLPIEWLIGKVDVFVSSDWLQPPTREAKKVTTIHDLIVYKHPEGLAPKIIAVQKRKLAWVKKEADLVICDSLSTKKDVTEVLGINDKKLMVIYPGGACPL